MACLFCSVVAGSSPADVVYQDDQVTAFRDIRPQAPTHILVVPNEHIPSAAEVDERHAAVLARMVTVAGRLAAGDGAGQTGYRLVFNVGRDAGQSVDHLHLHVLGGRRLTWPPG